jgi:hypothetical protein
LTTPTPLTPDALLATVNRLSGELSDGRRLTEKLVADRDRLAAELETAKAEVDDFIRAWAILDEPTELGMRRNYTATEAAQHFRDTLSIAKTERDALLASRREWPPEILEAARSGDVERLRAWGEERHDNWDKLNAERDRLAAELALIKATHDPILEQRNRFVDRNDELELAMRQAIALLRQHSNQEGAMAVLNGALLPEGT